MSGIRAITFGPDSDGDVVVFHLDRRQDGALLISFDDAGAEPDFLCFCARLTPGQAAALVEQAREVARGEQENRYVRCGDNECGESAGIMATTHDVPPGRCCVNYTSANEGFFETDLSREELLLLADEIEALAAAQT